MHFQTHPIWRLISGVFAIVALATVILKEAAYADKNHEHEHEHEHERGSRRARREEPSPFAMGICVGQTAAQQGVTLPLPEAGKPLTLDESQKEAFHSAMESCRAEFYGRKPVQPTPTASSVMPSITATPSVIAPVTAIPIPEVSPSPE